VVVVLVMMTMTMKGGGGGGSGGTAAPATDDDDKIVIVLLMMTILLAGQVKTLEEAEAALKSPASPAEAFKMFMLVSINKGLFMRGFDEPYLVDTEAEHGWSAEPFAETARRVMGEGSGDAITSP
jgi:hypothetical protein